MLRLPLLLPSADKVNYKACEARGANERLHKHRVLLLPASRQRRGGGGSAVLAPAWAHVHAAAPALPGPGLCPSPDGARGCSEPGAGIASLHSPLEICPCWADMVWVGCPTPLTAMQHPQGPSPPRCPAPVRDPWALQHQRPPGAMLPAGPCLSRWLGPAVPRGWCRGGGVMGGGRGPGPALSCGAMENVLLV